jgi:hypothetical protein
MKPSATDLQQLPGIGPNIANHLQSIGIRRVADLKGKDPEELYERICQAHSKTLDRCLLYVFRCAVYAASTPRPKARLLKWWEWKDGGTESKRRR